MSRERAHHKRVPFEALRVDIFDGRDTALPRCIECGLRFLRRGKAKRCTRCQWKPSSVASSAADFGEWRERHARR